MNYFLSEVRIFAFNFAPRGWIPCDGQVMPVNQNTGMFSLLGTNFGGDGHTTFGLPDLQGAGPVGSNTGAGPVTGLTPRSLGETGGSKMVTLIETEIPAHNHAAKAMSSVGGLPNPASALMSKTSGLGKNIFTNNIASKVDMNSQAIGITGNNQPHNNMMPYLGLNFCIAIQGDFPTRPI